MEENLKAMFEKEMSDREAGSLSPLVLAFLGDAVHELYIRTMLVSGGNARPKDLNRQKTKYVKAAAQSALVGAIGPLLTEREEEIYRRGRNASPATMAKNASVADYRRATGYEALAGYLYLTGQTERLVYLIRKGMETDESN